MILNDILDLVSKDKRKNERVNAVQKVVVGLGVVATVGVATGIILAPKAGKETRDNLKKTVINSAETIKDMVHKNVETVKDSAEQVAEDVSDTMEEVHGKTEGVQKDIKSGYIKISKDIHKTAKNISNKLK